MVQIKKIFNPTPPVQLRLPAVTSCAWQPHLKPGGPNPYICQSHARKKKQGKGYFFKSGQGETKEKGMFLEYFLHKESGATGRRGSISVYQYLSMEKQGSTVKFAVL